MISTFTTGCRGLCRSGRSIARGRHTSMVCLVRREVVLGIRRRWISCSCVECAVCVISEFEEVSVSLGTVIGFLMGGLLSGIVFMSDLGIFLLYDEMKTKLNMNRSNQVSCCTLVFVCLLVNSFSNSCLSSCVKSLFALPILTPKNIRIRPAPERPVASQKAIL